MDCRVKVLLLIVSLLATGCARINFTSEPPRPLPNALYQRTNDLKMIRQCRDIVHVKISEDLGSSMRAQIKLAMRYWNGIAKRHLFIEAADFTTEFIKVSSDAVNIDSLASTRLTYAKNGCIVRTQVKIPIKILHLPKVVLQNIIRHELGHVLGLNHSWSKRDLMYPTTKTRYNLEYKELSLWEIEAFSEVYK